MTRTRSNMIPRCRAWHIKEKVMWNVLSIDFHNQYITVSDSQSSDSLRIYYFDEVILMLSTGLKDKNGKEIWESDILVYYEEKPPFQKAFVVEWDAPQFWWYGSELRRDRPTQSISIVAGNIYENPRLVR